MDTRVICALLVTLGVYVRGWLRGRRTFRDPDDLKRLLLFTTGLGVVFLALESPLDAFDGLYLSAHMTQHMLLMMAAPLLVLLGRPTVPLLHGLPKTFVKEALAPFLTFSPLKRFISFLVSPPIAFLLFAASTILWHLPRFYELALLAPAWHSAQHACFFWTGICYWWPVIEQRGGRSHWPRWAMIPYLLLGDVLNTALSAFFIFSGRLFYPSYAAASMNPSAALRDQALAGAIMWVPGSVVYLIPAILIAVRLFSIPEARRKFIPLPKKLVQITATRRRLPSAPWHRLRRLSQVVMLALALAVIADGLRGTPIAPLNLAGVLPWIYWRALSAAALLTIGNAFCMACPFTLVRDGARRIFPPRFRWPRRLRNKWIPAVLFVLFLWTYEAFALWNSPAATAGIIIGYFLTAVAVDSLFRGASFCKYVCPIGQFHFIGSLLSFREIGVRNMETCRSCATHDCIKGNDQARGCELGLFQPKKAGSLDCTFCLDCVHACPHDNVGLLATAPGKTLLSDPYRSSIGKLSKRTDLMVMALLIVFGAFINAAGMISPVTYREHELHAAFGKNAMPLAIALVIFAGVIAAPACAVVGCGLLNRLVLPTGTVQRAARRFSLALVPLGMAMWAAHLLFHFATGWKQAGPAIETFLHRAPRIPAPPIAEWLLPAQFLLLDAGLLLTMYVVWRIAVHLGGEPRVAIRVSTPWIALAGVLYSSGVWILFQPMEMRGMIH